MPDVKTRYMGLELANPVIVGSSTHTITPEKVKALEEAGAAAVVLKSIFEEQIRLEVTDMFDALEQQEHAEAYEYLRADYPMQIGPETYLDRLRAIKAAANIPVIASVNCVDADRWVAFGRKIEQAGADALELNIYDIAASNAVESAEIEDRHIALVEAVTAEVGIPVAVKIGPYYTSLPRFAARLNATQARAVVMFNRFFQPDIDIEELALKPAINLSRPDDIRLPLRWIALLRSVLICDIALTSGVHDAAGVIKALLAGANTVQICSVLYHRDPSVIGELVRGLEAWMGQHGFYSVEAFRGRMAVTDAEDRQGYERAQYVKSLVGLE